VANDTIAFVFGMPLDNLTGQQQVVRRICMCLHGTRQSKSSENERPNECRHMFTHLIFVNRDYMPYRTEHQHVYQWHMENVPQGKQLFIG
jgi:hypothetical protein